VRAEPKHSNYYRTYDPSTGRYLEADPLGIAAAPNPYRYARSNPLRFYDPDGQDARERLGALWSVGPLDAYRGGVSIRGQAESMAENSGLGGPHNGPQDAYRHCLWSYLMTQRLGPEQAERLGSGHEAAGGRGGQPSGEEAMDSSNNQAGRECGLDRNRDCGESCMERLRNGELSGVGGVRIPPSSTPPPPPNPGPQYP
jgi:uncharacterized protein RhaS with RHS repeats